MLILENISKTFGSIKALEKVNLSLDTGEMVFLVGPSGAGKTTLFKIIAKEIMPDEGKIIFEGKDATKIKAKDIPFYRKKIGVVFQDFKLLAEKTVGENLELVMAALAVPRSEWKKRAKEVLIRAGLSGKKNAFPAQLSGGEVQRVAIARAMVGNPSLILADEPTGNLDWETGWQMIEMLETARKHGTTVLVASHNKDIIKRTKHRVVELSQGKIQK